MSGATAVFPPIEARNLNGRRLALPAGFAGVRNVVIVAFPRWHQPLVDAWFPVLHLLLAAYPDLRAYELPMIASGYRLVRPVIDGGMAVAIPDPLRSPYGAGQPGHAGAQRGRAHVPGAAHDDHRGGSPQALGLLRSALTERGLAFAAPDKTVAASLTFHASIELHGKTATGIAVPAEVVRALGAGKRPAVRVMINGYTYRSTVAAYREAFMLPLSAEHREAAGVSAGDQIAVTLELDQEPRTVTVPDDLAGALAAFPGATAAFDTLSYTERKEAIRQVESAKTPATRERRIAGIVTKLSAG
jgi:hypothetical protein